MLVLDTNVISEFMRPVPNSHVMEWHRQQPSGDISVTALTEAEIKLGIEIMPAGNRQSQLAVNAIGLFEEDFAGKILAFDSRAAAEYVKVVSGRRKAGRPVAVLDAQIAAIARAADAVIVTRNVGDFEGCGLKIINPWDVWTAGA